MHLKRQETTTKLPIKRKGTAYVVRASSHYKNSVPVLIAVRDMLKLAKTAKEVKEMIKGKVLKLNGRIVEEPNESIRLFSIFEADKPYQLTLSATHKFIFEAPDKKDSRLCKVIGKKLLKGNTIQLNLHDGSNVISKDKIKINDSLILDFSGKIKSHITLDKGKKVFIFSGKYLGMHGKIESIDKNSSLIKIDKMEENVSLPLEHVIVI